ncbi:MAG: ASKHA domain-containing protein [Paludibacteraceae bacterium]
MVNINFINQDIVYQAVKGETILAAARKAGITIEAPCNGVGTCGKCKVLIENIHGTNIVCEEGRHHLTPEEIESGYVLACQTKVFSDITVVYDNTAKQNKTLKILSDGQSFDYAIKRKVNKFFDGSKTIVTYEGVEIGCEVGNTTKELYGLSVDIGTTTVVTALIDMNSGEEITSVSELNPQSLHAQDVLTRIKFASDVDGLTVMYNEITESLNSMIADITAQTNIDPSHIYEAVYSGNTTMIHLACNVNPATLGRYPYTPQIRGGNNISADALNISPFGKIYLPPIISSYVGPDITSGVLVSRLEKKKGTTLFIDIGTNGEMVIAKDGSLSATSTAAGPAFEGMNITFGMRAGKGALERFEITAQNDIAIRVIGDVPATGICGSGLLDIVGELVRVGIIGVNGKFQNAQRGNYNVVLEEYLKEYEGKPAFEITEGIYLTQKDMRQVQLAKGSVRAGVEALLLSQNVSAENVDLVQIAGSFGYHLKAGSLINIGLLPREFEGKIKFVGNTSKTGGKAFLLNSDFRTYMENLVGKITGVELANRDDFDKLFVRALNF